MRVGFLRSNRESQIAGLESSYVRKGELDAFKLDKAFQAGRVNPSEIKRKVFITDVQSFYSLCLKYDPFGDVLASYCLRG